MREEVRTSVLRWPDPVAAREQYLAAAPWPHLVLDDVLPPELVGPAAAAAVAFAPAAKRSRTHRVRKSEASSGAGPAFDAALDALENPASTAFLRALTGIDDLRSDPTHLLGGLHASRAGDHQALHADFTRSGTTGLWHRANVLLYLGDWDPAWGGALLLHDTTGTHPDVTVDPAPGRVVVFETHAATQHAVLAMDPPPGVWRVSAASYWYSDVAPTELYQRPRFTRPALEQDGRLARLAPPLEMVWGHRPTLDASASLRDRLRHLLRR